MGLNKCKDCGHEVSSRAKSCPNCGAPMKGGFKFGCLSLIGFVILLGLISSLFNNKPSSSFKSEPVKIQSAAEIRKERIKKQFSGWDGSHYGLERLIKKTMNDPDSYKHDETRYSDQGDYLIVKTTFRGKNAFGGMVINSVTAKVDLDGNVIQVLSQGQ